MALFGNVVEKASAELRKLQEARWKLEAEEVAGRERLAALKAALPDSELEELLGGSSGRRGQEELLGGPGTQIRRQIADLESKLSGLAAARPKLMDRIREALRAHAHARAEVIRKDAGKLQAKYAAHQEKTAELLAVLEQHAGIRYEMAKHPVIPAGHVFLPTELPRLLPTSATMKREINGLLAEADAIEQQAASAAAGGRVTAETLGELVAAIGDNPLAPTRPAIEAWFADVNVRADADWQRAFPGLHVPERRVAFTLAWQADASIDTGNSQAANHARSPFETGAGQAADRAYIAAFAGRIADGRGLGVMPPG